MILHILTLKHTDRISVAQLIELSCLYKVKQKKKVDRELMEQPAESAEMLFTGV